MAAERLSKDTVAERALSLGDEVGLEAVTIRRLAQELHVSPMALYWHFKNKEELFLGIVDHVLSGLRLAGDEVDPMAQLRHMVETLVTLMRAHPVLPDLLHACDKSQADGFIRATEDSLAILTRLGFTVEESFWAATYLLNGAIALAAGDPAAKAKVPEADRPEWRRQQRLAIERLPAPDFPMLVDYAKTYDTEPDLDHYYRFGVDLLMAAVATYSAEIAGRPGGVVPPR